MVEAGVEEASLRSFFVFGQKIYTMELDIFECIQKGGRGRKKLLKNAQVHWTDAFTAVLLV